MPKSVQGVLAEDAWAQRADASAVHVARVMADLYLDGHVGITIAENFLGFWDTKRNAPSLNGKTALAQFRELVE